MSKSKGFSANGRSKNIALLMSGSGESHIPKNIAMIRDVVSDPVAGYNFSVIERQRVTAEQAVEASASAARDVGDGGTMLWYFSSHGAPNGSLQTYSKMLRLKQITEGIKAARAGIPLKRLIVIVQACYSGQIVNGSAQVDGSYADNASSDIDIPAQLMRELVTDSKNAYSEAGTEVYGRLAEQILVMSASSKSEMSQYSSDGSHFTKALHKTFKQSTSNSSLTMAEFLSQVQKNVRSSMPQYRAEPEDVILREPLINTMGATVPLVYAALTEQGQLLVRGSEPLTTVEFCIGVTSETAKNCAARSQASTIAGYHAMNLSIPRETNKFYVTVKGLGQLSGNPVARTIRIQRRNVLSY